MILEISSPFSAFRCGASSQISFFGSFAFRKNSSTESRGIFRSWLPLIIKSGRGLILSA